MRNVFFVHVKVTQPITVKNNQTICMQIYF